MRTGDWMTLQEKEMGSCVSGKINRGIDPPKHLQFTPGVSVSRYYSSDFAC